MIAVHAPIAKQVFDVPHFDHDHCRCCQWRGHDDAEDPGQNAEQHLHTDCQRRRQVNHALLQERRQRLAFEGLHAEIQQDDIQQLVRTTDQGNQCRRDEGDDRADIWDEGQQRSDRAEYQGQVDADNP